jgi:acetyl-CoA/propionyl-CoA carboxylase biotin carboxyl carrier protein
VNDRRFAVKVIGPPPAGGIAVAGANSTGARPAPRRERGAGAGADGASGSLVSPLQGTVLKVHVKKGEEVEAGAVICVIEAMKMENEITAPVAGKVEELNVSEGGAIGTGDPIALIK